MSIEARLKLVEDRLALQDVLTAYCNAVDSLSDMQGLLNCFTEDAVLDLSGISLPRYAGHAGIREFFAQVFKDMSHHSHTSSNFTILRLEGDAARCQASVIGTGRAHSGNTVLVYVRYFMDYARTASGWKWKHFSENVLMPLPESMTQIHAR